MVNKESNDMASKWCNYHMSVVSKACCLFANMHALHTHQARNLAAEPSKSTARHQHLLRLPPRGPEAGC